MKRKKEKSVLLFFCARALVVGIRHPSHPSSSSHITFSSSSIYESRSAPSTFLPYVEIRILNFITRNLMAIIRFPYGRNMRRIIEMNRIECSISNKHYVISDNIYRLEFGLEFGIFGCSFSYAVISMITVSSFMDDNIARKQSCSLEHDYLT